MASVTATSSGMAAVSSTVADPASGRRRPVPGRARAHVVGLIRAHAATAPAEPSSAEGATTSADPEEGADVVEDAVEEIGDGAVAGPGQGE